MIKYFSLLACFLLALANLNAQDCDGVDIIQTANITSNDVIAAEQTLTASNQIIGTPDVTYQAANYVLLTGGMFVEGTATLLAKTAACTPVSVKNSLMDDFELTLSGNPTTGYLALNFTTDNSLELEITMVDLLGRSVKTIQEMESLTAGDYMLTADVSDLSQGTYFLYFKTSTQKYHTSKVVKL